MANTDIITTAREIHTTEQQIADARTARNRTDIARLNRQHRKLTATLQQMTIAALNNGADAGTLRAQVWAALDGKATTPADLEQVIVDTIHQLAAEPDAWVSSPASAPPSPPPTTATLWTPPSATWTASVPSTSPPRTTCG